MLSLRGSKFRPRPGDTILNWGSHHYPDGNPAWQMTGWINSPRAVGWARDKIGTFRLLGQRGAEVGGPVPTVDWTTDGNVAREWNKEHTVIARLTTTGQGGAGIVVLPPLSEWIEAPLYTKLFRARHEYRVHAVRGEGMIDVQKKRRRSDGAGRSLVRNLENGYVYCRGGVVAPEAVVVVSVAAIDALGLDFGAVDVLCTEAGVARVLEVNTAPGLEGSTVAKYAEALNRLITLEN
jgi:glutathione synthase/RimK-type ligase-like ATP-grasp enzyme